MAEVEEPQYNTLAERIAALNKQKNFSSNGAAPAARTQSPASPAPLKKRPPPPPPPVGKPSTPAPSAPTVQSNEPLSPELPSRPSANGPPPLPRRDTQNSQNSNVSTVRPPLPSRTSSSQTRPGLPPSRSTTQSNLLSARRGSASSEVSIRSNLSGASLGRVSSSGTSIGSDMRKLAPAYDASSLPKLPPTKREREAQARADEAAQAEATRSRAPLASRKSSSSVLQIEPAKPSPADKPSLPPRLPSRPTKTQENATIPRSNNVQMPSRPAQPYKITGFGSGKTTASQVSQPHDVTSHPTTPGSRPKMTDDAPPPVPMASRPSAAQIETATQRPAATSVNSNSCWLCRDWSGPDSVAAQFPQHSLDRRDPVGQLARGLCDPFPSYTDKARAIFTWFHHNIHYDTAAFFGNNVRHHSVEDTIFDGKAVCQGYAETYMAIAQRAGLECILIGGHGKGYGYTKLEKGQRPPPEDPKGHAWNAVRVDGGEWKLLDACWGAGHVSGETKEFTRKFSPLEFVRPNDIFGRTHFPKNPNHQLRLDGKVVTWEEYYTGGIDGESVKCYNNCKEEGIAEESIEPKESRISVSSGRIVRFQFSKICEHWKPEKHGLGKPPLVLLEISGANGSSVDRVPMETNGYWHWLDVHARDLGAPGQQVKVLMITSFDGGEGRGLTAQRYLSKKGKVAMAWTSLMMWELGE